MISVKLWIWDDSKSKFLLQNNLSKLQPGVYCEPHNFLDEVQKALPSAAANQELMSELERRGAADMQVTSARHGREPLATFLARLGVVETGDLRFVSLELLVLSGMTPIGAAMVMDKLK